MSGRIPPERCAPPSLVSQVADAPAAEPQIEQMTAYACDAVADVSFALAALPVELARLAPTVPALQLVLVLASAADATQSMFGTTGPSGQRSQELWKQAALIGVDVLYLSLLGRQSATAGDLLEYWSQQNDTSNADDSR